MRAPLLALLMCSTAGTAWALSDPAVSSKDGADRTVVYDAHNRVPLVIQQGGIVVLTFDPMESIEQVIKTDVAPFTYTCDGADQKQQCETQYSNNLPLIGRGTGTGDLVVLTRAAAPADKERAYLFAVKVISNGDDPTITKHMTFTYTAPDRPAPEPRATVVAMDQPDTAPPPPKPRPLTWKQKQDAKEAAIYTAAMQSDVRIGTQNDRYVAQGRDHQIAPVSVTDNFHITGFRYPGNMPQPSVFKVLDGVPGTPPICTGGRTNPADLNAQEQAVNTLVRGDFIIVQETWPHWRLRSGEAVVDVWNCNYNAIGNNPGTGTDSPDTVRRVIRR